MPGTNREPSLRSQDRDAAIVIGAMPNRTESMGDAAVERERLGLSLWEAVAKVEALLSPEPPPTAFPVLLMLSGLPGAGKTYLARRILQRVPFVMLESDRVRKALFPEPTYEGWESSLVHRACHIVAERLLKRGVGVLYDATNLVKFHRRFAYRIASKLRVQLVVVRVVAPPEVIRERLRLREENPDPNDASDADWAIYERMAPQEEPIERDHLVVDTSKDIDEAVAKVLRQLRRLRRDRVSL